VRNGIRKFGALVAASAGLTLGACGHKENTRTAAGDIGTPPSYSAPAADSTDVDPAHHSKLKGALIGAAAGHVLGGHAMAGAAAGALLQHERNKHP
jgi:hypothetical protein